MFYISDLYKIRNLLPIIYTANDLNSASKLIILYPKIKDQYKNINIFFVFHDEIQQKFPFDFIMANSTFEKNKGNFAKNYYLNSDDQEDIISKFGRENKLDLFYCNAKNQNINNIYYKDINHKYLILNKISSNLVQINSYADATNEIFAVAGTESPDLLALASIGRKIILINSKPINSFQKMFPDTLTIL